LRIIADENIHRKVIAGLRAEGHDVLSVAESRSSVDDEAVLEWAREESCLLLTSDRDFGRLLIAEAGRAPAGVLYLRLPRRGVETILDRVRDLLEGDRDLSDHLVVVAPAGERWRPLGS
jgi:predicted nuclease of predicted toxin-antitoxin system